jgi:translation initiation factor IF-3
VKATIFFRGREMAHPEIGRRILERLITDLGEVVTVESAPRQEGNQMHAILAQRVGTKSKSAGDGARRSSPAPAAATAGPAAESPEE